MYYKSRDLASVLGAKTKKYLSVPDLPRTLDKAEGKYYTCGMKAFSYFIKHFDFSSSLKAVFSGGRGECTRADARAVRIGGDRKWQLEKRAGTKVCHFNCGEGELLEEIEKIIDDFRQINIVNPDEEVQLLVSKKGKVTESVRAQKAAEVTESHDRPKKYIFAEGEDIASLRDLGVFTADNRIVKAKYDKFRQINRFIELIDDEFNSFEGDEITMLDFGCGKSYLTFLAYYYFKQIKKINIRAAGYDLKADVVESCNRIAKKYGYDGLRFAKADIKDEGKTCFDVDMIITLHACDTATDYALYNAMANNVKYIFSVPCCQHEVNGSIRATDEMSLLLKHGLIKERFSALVTDAVRCEILSAFGYEVDVLEFVDFSHTPKNLMIRAVRTGKPRSLDAARALASRLGFSHTLLELAEKQRKRGNNT